MRALRIAATGFLAVVAWCVVGAPAFALPFAPATGSPYTTGTTPAAVVAADLDGDGRADAAVANVDSNDVSVFLGDGTGALAAVPGSPFATPGTRPNSLAVADFDHDGALDIATGNSFASSIAFLRGDGAGGFAAGPSVATPGQPPSVETGDFDGDGNPDLVAPYGVGVNGYVGLYLGDGAGTFSAGATADVGRLPGPVVVADFDGNGTDDVAATSQFNNSLSILLGDGAGHLTLAGGSPVALASRPTRMAAGDLDGDGNVDLAIGARSVSGSPNEVEVLLGDGAGGFSPAPGPTVPAGSGVNALAIADFDHDGAPDILATRDASNLQLITRGPGGVFARTGADVPVAAARLAVADFNGDGWPDLAVVSGASGTTLSVLLNTPTAPPAPAPAPGAALPVVDAVSPAEGGPAGGESVTISGQNFTALRSVWFDDVPAASFRVERYDRIVAVAPPHAAGTVPVRVETDTGTSAVSAAAAYAYRAAIAPPVAVPPAPGPAGAPEVPPPGRSCVVPQLRGLRLAAARRQLRRAGCALGNVRHLKRGHGPRRRVVRQAVAAGTRTAGGRHVAVAVRATRR